MQEIAVILSVVEETAARIAEVIGRRGSLWKELEPSGSSCEADAATDNANSYLGGIIRLTLGT